MVRQQGDGQQETNALHAALRILCNALACCTGSENQKTSGAMGEQFKESIKINKSLSTLGLVISRLAHTSKGCAEHVPYRDSRLTWLLKACLMPLAAPSSAQRRTIS